MTHNDFVIKYLSSTVDYDNKFGYQCTDLAKAYSKEVLGINPGAFGGAAKNASKSTFPSLKIIDKFGPSVTLKQGDILITNATPTNSYGHVGVIHKVDRFGYYLIEQNGDTGSGSGSGNNAIRVQYYLWSSLPLLRVFRK